MSVYRGVAYKDGPENSFCISGRARIGRATLFWRVLGRARSFWVFRFLFIFKPILELKLIL